MTCARCLRATRIRTPCRGCALAHLLRSLRPYLGQGSCGLIISPNLNGLVAVLCISCTSSITQVGAMSQSKHESGKLHLLSRGKVHKAVYFPGSQVDFEVTILCTDDEGIRQERKETPTCTYSDNKLAALFDRSHIAIPSDSDTLTVKVACAQIIGMCFADSTWINDINEYEDQLSAPFGMDREKSPEGDSSWWSWFGGKAEETRGPVKWVEGSLPVPIMTHRQGNCQKLLETEAKELLPRDTKMKRGSSRNFALKVKLPSELPPSYSGYSMRYVYHVWCCIVWSYNGTVKQHVLKLPLTIWNPAASLRPIRPPYTPKDFDFRWFIMEIATNHQSDASRRAAMPCFADYGETRWDDSPCVFSDVTPSPDGRNGSAPVYCPSPASVMGELLGEDVQNSNTVPEPEHVDTLPHHVNNCQTIEHLLSLPQQQETFVKHNETPFLKLITSGVHCCIGDSVSGLLSVVENSVCRCARVSVRLEYEELVPENLFKSGTFVPSPRRQFPRTSDERPEFVKTKTAQSKTVEEFDETMIDCVESSYEFVISPNCPPTMYTDKVAVEWYLSFEFYFVLRNAADDYLSDGGISCERPIVWQLPLQVHAPPHELKNSCKSNSYMYAT
eukprot:TRINITY_DN4234_c0_g1_i1.p1 TRINITY_DN4234_c0_g1~~TRINITY_DN4234_c0_g1_i1.p1  ORF type:complete len:615 (+),score=100.33 TRINITY_DN4234_c0_g1_i1:1025-2869(+)